MRPPRLGQTSQEDGVEAGGVAEAIYGGGSDLGITNLSPLSPPALPTNGLIAPRASSGCGTDKPTQTLDFQCQFLLFCSELRRRFYV